MAKLAPMLWLAVSMSAATIGDTETSVTLQTGDKLAFEIVTSNFGINAARLGLLADPTDVSFVFATAPMGSDVPFSAWIESSDGAVSIPFAGPLYFTPGWLSSVSYTGPVSTLSGYQHLTASDSLALFATGAATLLLVDDGPEIMLGLPPDSLHNDLRVTLSGGPLTVGAWTGSVALEPGNRRASVARFPASVPEPNTCALFAALVVSFGYLRVRNRARAGTLKRGETRFLHLIC
jgi:hypothetical protein